MSETPVENVGTRVALTPDWVGPEVEALADALKPGEIPLLENLRYHAEETKDDEGFARRQDLAGTHAISEEIGRRDLKISVIGVPKTIDNDISFVEKSFGGRE